MRVFTRTVNHHPDHINAIRGVYIALECSFEYSKVWSVQLEVFGNIGRLLLQIRYLWVINERRQEFRDRSCKFRIRRTRLHNWNFGVNSSGRFCTFDSFGVKE
ncbi:unnamed protein product [Brassica oleracea]